MRGQERISTVRDTYESPHWKPLSKTTVANLYLKNICPKDGEYFSTAFELWSKNAQDIQRHLKDTSIRVSDFLEKHAPEKDKEDGKDIADYLINLDWRQFRGLNV